MNFNTKLKLKELANHLIYLKNKEYDPRVYNLIVQFETRFKEALDMERIYPIKDM